MALNTYNIALHHNFRSGVGAREVELYEACDYAAAFEREVLR